MVEDPVHVWIRASDPGLCVSRIFYRFDMIGVVLRIRDPVPFLTPRAGMGKNQYPYRG
jgi:hypothetical protein